MCRLAINILMDLTILPISSTYICRSFKDTAGKCRSI